MQVFRGGRVPKDGQVLMENDNPKANNIRNNGNFPMDEEFSNLANVSMQGLQPSSVDLEYSVDEIPQLLDEHISNEVPPIGSTTTHVSKGSQKYIPPLKELGFTESKKRVLFDNKEPARELACNGKEET
jgi:hypothetical protein